MPYLAAYHQVGGAVCVGSYRENGVVETVLHVLRHPGLQKMPQDVRCDVLFLKTVCNIRECCQKALLVVAVYQFHRIPWYEVHVLIYDTEF